MASIVVGKEFSEILERIERSEAVVLTAEEVSRLVEKKDRSSLEEVDVVTTATRAVMSGTYAILSFPVAEPGSFQRARNVWLNGISAQVGPCPNEKLGVLDMVIFGTTHSRDRPDYGGGHLFRDLVEGKTIQVAVQTDEGGLLQAEVGLEDMPQARMFGSRHAFKNYSAFVNPGSRPVRTIFHARGFEPHCQGATFSGCGQINPLKCDPLLETIGIGTRILLNGAEGYVLGTGTRSSRDKPNLSGFADMHHMTAEYMGGFVTGLGPECICSLAVPIPVTSPTILEEIARRDREIALPVNDINTRTVIGQANYGDVWEDVDLEVEFDPQRCRGCKKCLVERACPMRAVRYDQEARVAIRDGSLCFHCGLCVTECPNGAFRCRLGALRMKTSSGSVRSVPVVLRQSDRLRAGKLSGELKRRILEGSFRMAPPIERIG
ncbi:methanogenesis marker 16 metalloprotein [Methanothrix soehngenii]|jgi:putative methanogenesis marker 16 metalloprotein|uniref:methanogenesis marker 16 metalloprotein n=1 Tax=Methanothrix soehngenii TaxID=2223 RepID=UPI0023F214BB|nr:methanogenesis marker 16 metalloprotein [Methanothrix soehngenii]MCK9586321.1 methanogenesis marker 16 metalloprotein [Methanothrix soehngenii]MDD5256802.1 methanogenesis marker 16 metalloprotein [Methanothrix soehngenii]